MDCGWGTRLILLPPRAERFRRALRPFLALQVGGQEDNRATAESVDMHLNMLRGAVAAYGGSVEVVGVEQVSC